MVGLAVLGQDRVRVSGGPVEPQPGSGPDILARPGPGAVGHRTGGERLDPPGGLVAFEQGRGGGHVHALTGAARRVRGEYRYADLGPYRDVARMRDVGGGNPEEPGEADVREVN